MTRKQPSGKGKGPLLILDAFPMFLNKKIILFDGKKKQKTKKSRNSCPNRVT